MGYPRPQRLQRADRRAEVEHYVELLDARTIADAWTTSAEVEHTKPQPDLVNSALAKAGADAQDAVMVGDTTWDIHAAQAAKVPTIAVRTGGFGQDELEDAGATAVYESVASHRRNEPRYKRRRSGYSRMIVGVPSGMWLSSQRPSASVRRRQP
jgi:beta-phosphoglucomutase-like phosphatase (HAD superfamily)